MPVQVPAMVLLLGWLPTGGEWMVIVLFGLLLFGKRLPKVGKSLGKGIIEFKRGLKGVEDEIERSVEHRRSERGRRADISPHQLAAGGMGLLAGVCIFIGLRIAESGQASAGGVMVVVGLAVGVMAWGMHRS